MLSYSLTSDITQGLSVRIQTHRLLVGASFSLSDNLLKVLTLSNVRRSMTYDDFLTRLYQRYGLVVDTKTAHASKLYRQLNINQKYYEENADLLLERMLNAGLAQKYSDATAMINVGKLVMDNE